MAVSKIFFFLVIAVIVSAATASTAQGPSLSLSPSGRLTDSKFVFQNIINQTIVKACITEINNLEECSIDNLISVLNLQFNITKSCCGELAMAGTKCLAPIFTILPAVVNIIPILKNSCNVLATIVHH